MDSEILLAKLRTAGVELTADISSADCVVINTCGFVEDAKRESVETILEMAESGKRVIVMGCLVERYRRELEKEIPEVEGFFGTESWDEILTHLGLKPRHVPFRILTTSGSYAYVKIAEGCNRLCSFCAIPMIRGRHRSRHQEEIVSEVKDLAERGVKEVILISQDTTYYGRDGGGTNIVDLLRRLEEIEGIEWIRLLYLYPTEVSGELIAHIRDSEKTLPYFDIPVQHIADSVLRSMRRGYNERHVRELVERVRKEIPSAVLRTTLIVGYPTEGEAEFRRLRSFVEEGHFHWLGVFTYSREEGTPAYDLGDPLPEEVKEERRAEILALQREITARRNARLVGRRLKVLVDGGAEEFPAVPKGRAYLHAPEVDGCVYLETERELKAGDFVEVEITQSADYDVAGRVMQPDKDMLI